MPAGLDAATGDALVSAFFSIDVGAIQGFFTEVSGLGSEHAASRPD